MQRNHPLKKNAVTIIVAALIALCFPLKSFSQKGTDSSLALLRLMTRGLSPDKPVFNIKNRGLDAPINYFKYGEFKNVNTSEYAYEIKSGGLLQKAVGDGIYPNDFSGSFQKEYADFTTDTTLGSKTYSEYFEEGQYLRAFYILSRDSNLPRGQKTLLTGDFLKETGHLMPALKAYQAALVHFPMEKIARPSYGDYLYVGGVALLRINELCRDYPSMGFFLSGAKFSVENYLDGYPANDVVKVDPGYFISRNPKERRWELNPDTLKIGKEIVRGSIRFVNYDNLHWQMFLNGQSYFIRGIYYQAPDEKAPSKSWTDSNNDGQRDEDEKSIGDFELLRKIGVNTVFVDAPFGQGFRYTKDSFNLKLYSSLYHDFGIRIVIRLPLFLDEELAKKFYRKSASAYKSYFDQVSLQIKAAVNDLKDYPFVSGWELSELPFSSMVRHRPIPSSLSPQEDYYRFFKKIASLIRSKDLDHPLILEVRRLRDLWQYKRNNTDIDIIGVNLLGGDFDNFDFWDYIKNEINKPVLVSAYGASSAGDLDLISEDTQRQYHQKIFRDVIFNQARGVYSGNSLGGVIYRFLDRPNLLGASQAYGLARTVPDKHVGSRILKKAYRYYYNLYKKISR